jgi:replicative DNA helicase
LVEALDLGLRPEHFSSPKWGAAYGAILDLANRGDAIDAVTVDTVLQATSGPRPDADALAEAWIGVPSVAHLPTYARQVVDCARLRAILAAAAEITDAAYGPEAQQDPDAFSDWSESLLFTATVRTGDLSSLPPLGEVLDETIIQFRDRASGIPLGLPTGFIDLDRQLGGMRAGQLIVLGARPSMGKSALALDIALTVAEAGRPVLFVSAEMGRHEIGTRLLARGGVASDRLLSGQLDALDFERMERRRVRLADVPLQIDDSPGTTLLAIRSKARRLAARDGLGLVVVDYLQLVTGEGRRERRELEVAEVSRGLKSLARELGVPVLALAQLNRAVELRTNKRPLLADLRESGQLEQDADVVLLLHRAAMYDLEADPGAAEVIVAKHRNGPTGSVHLTWLSHRMSFVSAAGAEAF